MHANLRGDKENAAWTFMSYFYGPIGAEIRLRHGIVPTYLLDIGRFNIDHLTRQYIELINSQTMGYVIDAVMDGEGVNNLLNPGIQAVMMGQVTSAQLAAQYEAWVAANDSNRRR
jgi:raffinose/stachyose/melibiose transport system substrate-binding protein